MNDVCLVPRSHGESVIDPYESGEMTIVMQANREPTADVCYEMMRYYRRDDEEEDSSDYVMMHKDDLTYTFQLLFPKV